MNYYLLLVAVYCICISSKSVNLLSFSYIGKKKKWELLQPGRKTRTNTKTLLRIWFICFSITSSSRIAYVWFSLFIYLINSRIHWNIHKYTIYSIYICIYNRFDQVLLIIFSYQSNEQFDNWKVHSEKQILIKNNQIRLNVNFIADNFFRFFFLIISMQMIQF